MDLSASQNPEWEANGKHGSNRARIIAAVSAAAVEQAELTSKAVLLVQLLSLLVGMSLHAGAVATRVPPAERLVITGR